ncbi:MAG TPA: hypothetical protein VF979_03150 [Streptosporangiaceae bacterium]
MDSHSADPPIANPPTDNPTDSLTPTRRQVLTGAGGVGLLAASSQLHRRTGRHTPSSG